MIRRPPRYTWYDSLLPDTTRFRSGVVDVEHVDLVALGGAVPVHADHHLLAAIDGGLPARRRFLDAQLRHARFHGTRHAAHVLDLVDQRTRRNDQAVGQALDVVGAGERIGNAGDARLVGWERSEARRAGEGVASTL